MGFAAAGTPIGDRGPPPGKVATVIHPTDPTLVLLHGATFNAHMWDAVRRHLDPKYRVIAPDLPGHGSRLGEPFSFAGAIATATSRKANKIRNFICKSPEYRTKHRGPKPRGSEVQIIAFKSSRNYSVMGHQCA